MRVQRDSGVGQMEQASLWPLVVEEEKESVVLKGPGDHGFISQAEGSLVLACISFNRHHWGLNFSGSVSLAGGGKQLGDSKKQQQLKCSFCS